MNRKPLATPLLAALAAAFALTACGRNDEQRSAGQKLDETIAKTQQGAAEAGADARRESAEAGAAIKGAAGEAKDATRSAAAKAGNAVNDAAITASVNAQLAKDAKLSAMKIDVDTSNGRVALRGTAPDAEAKARATQLASAVDGVQSVENQLRVEKM